jgi:putative hemolysin
MEILPKSRLRGLGVSGSHACVRRDTFQKKPENETILKGLVWIGFGGQTVKFKHLLAIASQLALLSTCLSAGAAELETYKYVFQGKTVSVPIGKIDGIRYNDVCVHAQEKCEALHAYRAAVKPAPSKSKTPWETYASDYCTQVGGTSLLMNNPKQAGALFCVFKDLSMVEARALATHAGQKAGKK